uniref:3-hydroxyacyl-CoA dehydrogenase NAD binding domain-containing protein n=1 Tax=Lactuca sativa TaxID=4236 RepID=A0A9R1UYP2_LACSA|nr:hypothetical protein LSAT_V11C700351410 [Lactuca sativa]
MKGEALLVGKNGRFSGGFDINVFQKAHKTGDISQLPDVSVALVTNTIEVVVVQGLALGGGLELAMGCHACVAAPRAQLGLPKFSLGVMPGFGGTQRLPRLLGLSKAIDMMLISKPRLSEEGEKLGLIDAIVPPQELLKALDIAEARKLWAHSLHRTDKIGSLLEAREIIKAARQHVKRTFPNLPQHQACLDVIEEGIFRGGYAGVLKVFNELVVKDTSKGLVHIFFAQCAISKVPKVTDVGLKLRRVKKVDVIGVGLMGEKALSLVNGVLDYSQFKDVDMVIEAVIENILLKQKIFSEIENICPPHCILATNTSTIDLNLIGAKIKSQDQVIGARFFSPAHMMPLLEIVRTEKTM